jgi:capsular polysaccharide export protein
MKYIILVDYFDSFQFFDRLLCDEKKEDVVFVTTLLSVKLCAGSLGYKSVLLSRFTPRLKLFPVDFSRAREVVSGDLGGEGAASYVERLTYAINSIDDGLSSYRLFCWTGSDLKGCVIRGMVGFEKDRFYSGFFEITNFPGYYFYDSKGVNAESSANLCPEVFLRDELTSDEYEKYHNLIQELIVTKKSGAVPQVALSRKVSIRHFYDVFYMIFFGVSNFRIKSMYSRFLNKIFSGSIEGVDVLSDIDDSFSYAFMPLQVSSDSQLLINYHGGVLDSISEALNIARSRMVKLVVKLHPAEKDVKVLNEIFRYCKANGIDIVNAPVYELIEKSVCVITVNSTVGFEAQIMKKDVVFIGDTQYSKLNSYLDVLLYVKGFFNEGDFFTVTARVKRPSKM